MIWTNEKIKNKFENTKSNNSSFIILMVEILNLRNIGRSTWKLQVLMHEQSLKIPTHLCWKVKVRVSKNSSDNREITAAICSSNLLYMW